MEPRSFYYSCTPEADRETQFESFRSMGAHESEIFIDVCGNRKSSRSSLAMLKRIGLKAGGTFSVGLGIVFMMIYLPLANHIISLFLPAGSASGVVDVARGYLFTVVPFYVVVCIKFVCDSVLRGAGAMRPFMITTFSDLILRVILSIALFYVIGNEHGIWISWPIGWFLGSGLSVFFYKTGAWRKDLPTL